jgi:hypothetical protein
MGRFESDPEVVSAFNVFKELNKHGMHLSVIRLFYKYEMTRLAGTRGYENMMSQFDFAKDHIEQMKVT